MICPDDALDFPCEVVALRIVANFVPQKLPSPKLRGSDAGDGTEGAGERAVIVKTTF